ncbi:hypothetical protein VPH35_045195 [Triticum aestivum]
MRNATLLLCTTSMRECELLIPLSLHLLKHGVLVGDDCQLMQRLEQSKVCKEVGFATSLFGSLVMLQFNIHLLNIQYHMNPSSGYFQMSSFMRGRLGWRPS